MRRARTSKRLMTHPLQAIEATAARGADGLVGAAREELSCALYALRRDDGGFAGLDGRSDPYYTLFAWLGLRALGASYDRDGLCAYMATHRRAASAVDAQCAALLLACEGRSPHATQWSLLIPSLLRGDTHGGAYALFLRCLAMRRIPRWAARAAWWHQRRLFQADRASRLPTPQLAAGLVLAALAGAEALDLVSTLEGRHRANGGFASAPNAPADLLATAVARFALGFSADADEMSCLRTTQAQDLAFIEACWQDDGLFGASPAATHGDAEHTFYGLLALGTCATVT
jgi:hypothetical protein